MDYHVVILGGGLAYTGAEILRNAGLRVAIIEKDPSHLGGVCLHEGCIPTKLYLFEARKIYDLRNSPLISLDKYRLSLKRLKDKKEKLTKELRNQIERLLKGVDLVYGYGELVEPYVIEVEGKRISGKHIIINTGKYYPLEPNGNHLLDLEEIPQRLKIAGDDPIALEFACIFSLLGSSVELYFEDSSLNFMHPSIKGRLIKMLKEIGIEIRALSEAPPDGIYWFKRRRPSVESIKVDVAKDSFGHIIVDRNYETSLRNHYAVGDVNGIVELAHGSRIQALSVAKRITKGKGFFTPPYKIPYILYTQPLSYGKVGLNRKDLEDKGIEFNERSVSFRGFAIGSMYHTEEGMAFLYFDKEGFLLGAELLSRDCGEVISTLAVSLFSQLNLDFLSKLCLPHPTISEVVFLKL